MATDERAQRAPQARTEDLSVQELGAEILIYDRTNDQAHCLGPVAARVWRACDGERPMADLGDAGEVTAALVELADKGLLVERVPSDGSLMSRRQMIGTAAAVAVTLPLIVSVEAPHAQANGSCVGQGVACVNGATGTGACCPGLTCRQVAGGGGGNRTCR